MRRIVVRLVGGLEGEEGVVARAEELGARAVKGVHMGPDFLLRGIAILEDSLCASNTDTFCDREGDK